MTQEPWWVKPGLAAMAMVIFAGAMVGTTFIHNETLQTAMFTTAASGFLMALGYFFGSAAPRSTPNPAVRQEPPTP